MTPTLVGRDEELQLLADMAEQAGRGQGGCIAIVGEAGVGKTSLADQWIVQLRRSGIAVHRGAATEVDQHRPFGVLRRALPDLAVDDDPIDGLLDHVERLAAGRPLAVVLDDLHWADTLTIAALGALVERSVELGLITACLSRQTPSSIGLNGLMDRIDRLGRRRRLAPLDDRGVAQLVEARFGSPCGPRLAEALDATAGNPFLAQEYLSGLVEDGLLHDDGSIIDLTSGESLPGSLALGLSARAHAAVPGGELVIDALAALPDGTSPDEIAGVLDLPIGTVIRHCLAATTAGVIVERERRIGFRHDLIRQAVAARTPATVRTAIARQAGDLLADQGADPDRIAACWLAGSEWAPAHIDRVVELGRRFCNGHPFAAIALLEPTVDRLQPDHPQLGQVIVDLAWALVAAGRAAEVESLVAGRLPETLGVDPLALEEVQSLARTLHGGLHTTIARLDAIDDARLDQVDLLTVEPVVVDRGAGMALMLAMNGRLPIAERVADLVGAAPAGNPYRAAFNESARAWIAIGAGRFESARDHGLLARAAADADPVRRLGVAVPAGTLAIAAGHLGNLDEAGSTIADALARSHHPRWGVPLLHAYHSMIHYRAGRWDDALTELDAAHGAARDVDLHLDAFFPTGALGALIADARGEVDRVNPPPDPEYTIAGSPTSPWHSWQLWADGMAAETSDELTALMPALEDGITAAEETNSPSRLLTGGADMVWWAMRSDRPDLADRITVHLEALTTRSESPVVTAIHRWARGAVTGDHQLIATAAQALTDHGYATEGLRAIRCSALSAAGVDDGAARAGAHIAFEQCQRLGAERWQHQLRADLRQLGINVRSRRSPRPARFGWDSLTPSENTIVDLLADGLSNREIAEQLVVSRRTVESHLRRVYTKLELSSRPQLLRAALDRTGQRAET